jgi:hypothetical protein
MTKDDIMKLARKAGLFTHKEVQPELERFANLVAAAALEQPEKKPLTDDEIMSHEWILSAEKRYEDYTMQESIVAVGAVDFARAIEQAHNIKEQP